MIVQMACLNTGMGVRCTTAHEGASLQHDELAAALTAVCTPSPTFLLATKVQVKGVSERRKEAATTVAALACWRGIGALLHIR